MSTMLRLINILIVLLVFETGRCSEQEAQSLLKPVTIGSTVKLQNIAYPKMRLHSHSIRYAGGSQQQSVTGRMDTIDSNSHWTVLGALDAVYRRGGLIPCDSIIRLQHLTTKKFLHSHHHASPLSQKQEVSAFGDDGLGDSGDHWQLICNRSNDSHPFWLRNDTVSLKHVDTGALLGATNEIYGSGRVNGQFEIVGLYNEAENQATKWKTNEGVFIKAVEFQPENYEIAQPVAHSKVDEL